MIVSSIIPEIQVSLHPNIPLSERLRISSSADVYDLALSFWNLDTINLYEEFVVVYLARNNGVIGYRVLGRGSNSGTVVNAQLILGIALKINASAIVLIHNHPSGNINPSRQDKGITDMINNAARFFDLKLYDHLIVTEETYFSFACEGLI